EAVDTLLAELAEIDPASAGALVESWEAGPVRDELLRRVAQLWAATDTAGAIEWVAHLPDPAEREQAATVLCHQLAATDPADAVRVAQLLGVGEGSDAFASLVRLWAERDLLA